LAALAGAVEAGIPRILVSDMAAPRLETAKAWGATQALNAGEVDVVAAVKDLTGGKGADAVIDAVGSAGTRDQALKAVVPGGRVVFIGLHEEHSRIEANYIVRQEISVTGCFAYTQSDFKRALDLLVRSAHPPVGKGFRFPSWSWLEERPLAQGGEAFADLVEGKAAAAKIVLRVA
jgi:threonine dehydrogenase-like Zn-dependent dehydrogenase